MGKMSPTQRTLKHLRKLGWCCQVVEKWIPRVNVRKDLFDAIDIVAIKRGVWGVLGVQATTRTNLSHRLAKAAASPALELWLWCRNHFQVWGWSQVNGIWRPKIVTLRAGQMRPVVNHNPRRRRRAGHQQGTLF